MTQQFDPQPPYAASFAAPPPPQMVAYASPGMDYYYPSARRGRVARALLCTLIVLELSGVGLKLYELSLPADALASDDVQVPMPYLLGLMLQGVLYIGLFIATAIVFCMWMFRAHANLGVLGRDDLEFTPGWAAGAWFVPILNLFRPFQIMKEIYKASTPRGITTAAWRSAPDPGILTLWWATWIISNIAANISLRMDPAGTNASVHQASLYLDLAITPITIAAAWLAIRITRDIDDMQAERYLALSQYAAEQQFPPDQYPPPQASRG